MASKHVIRAYLLADQFLRRDRICQPKRAAVRWAVWVGSSFRKRTVPFLVLRRPFEDALVDLLRTNEVQSDARRTIRGYNIVAIVRQHRFIPRSCSPWRWTKETLHWTRCESI